MLVRSHLFVIVLGLAAAWPAGLRGAEAASDGSADAGEEAVVRQLNVAWIRSYQACDVARFRQLLADDFEGVLADGRVIDKAEFLRQAAVPPSISGLRLKSVSIRLHGDAAIVSGAVSYSRAGTLVGTRYTATYLRADGGWRMESVQWTRISP